MKKILFICLSLISIIFLQAKVPFHSTTQPNLAKLIKNTSQISVILMVPQKCDKKCENYAKIFQKAINSLKDKYNNNIILYRMAIDNLAKIPSQI
jgi:hypothetical protein